MSHELTHDQGYNEVERIAAEAYLYFYPLVLMEITRRVSTNSSYSTTSPRGPMGALVHSRAYPTAQFKTVVRPNFDTLYSSAWLDVSDEPYVISLPAVDDRFFMFPLYDMWTEIFASPGTRTHGSGPMDFALCASDWRGTLPSGLARITAPTPTVWIIGRLETRGADDYSNVHKLQNQMLVAPLSRWPHFEAPAFIRDESIDMKTPPMFQVENLSARDFFLLASNLVTTHPPHATDWSMITLMARTGLRIGELFDVQQCDESTRLAYEAAPAVAREMMRRRFSTIAPLVNGWSSITDMGVWGNSYLKRAMIARSGLGANPPEESIYPNLQRDDTGQPLHGASSYLVRFEADQLPPVDAFWSITIYDEHGYQVANELDRFALGDRDELDYGTDGSLEVVLSHHVPHEHSVRNWLPVPEAPFAVTMRLYLPRDAALHGSWRAPLVRRLA
ncbi:MAG: DUF1254 domain-containing protein [Acidobacteria bacterium]|nr:DUF1254 domain-containing protein [Acidobacteriota bacterium]